VGPHVTSAGRIDDMSVVSFRTSRHRSSSPRTWHDRMKLADAVAEPLYRELASV